MASSSSTLFTSINSQTSSSSSTNFMTNNTGPSGNSFTSLLSSDNLNNNNNNNNNMDSSISWELGSYDHHDRLLGGNGSEFSKFKSFTPSSFPLSPPPVSPSSFLAFPPGLSPTELLDSPAIFSSSNALVSPTTGAFADQSFNWKNNSGGDNNQEEQKSSFSDFSFQQPQSRPLTATSSSPATSLSSIFQSSSSIVSGESTKVQQESWNFNKPTKQTDFLSEKTGVKTEFAPIRSFSAEMATLQTNNENTISAAPQQSYNHYSHSSQYVRESRRSDDGYNWRKYGQKQVKGSENPRSYYKCTHPNCPTKKKVETSLDGQITEIVYKGSHNHPKPQSTRRSSSHSIQSSLNNSEISDQSVAKMESGGMQDDSSISIGEDEFDQSSPISNTGGDDQDENEPDAKRRRGQNENENILAAGSRTVREPRVVVQTTSDIDILDDGYRWRKYGQKVVKGNPNPRSYYKCTSSGCPVRKHVERASHDTRAVITTYEGKHNHDVPAARGSSYSALNKPQPNTTSGSDAPIPIRPSAVSTHYNHTNYPNSLHTTRLPPSGSQAAQAPFTLEMLQNPAGSFGYSGFGRQAGTYMNQQNYTEGVFPGAKEEPKGDSFLDSFLS